MKILKIELKNINSLKSETPIVIDFESTLFKNIGLYAITGSTGAGKTTILDAITVALYHSVPRFNNSNIKAGLKDIVSYGAAEALSRVTFENKGIVYEAQWGIRLKSANGKPIKKPKETVRLKNLSAGQIIGEQKSKVKLEIEKICQLNYNQFLRSVMLAQGEFAAFLSANAKDKGTLLEQITGEEIYKKIGETVSNRKFEESEKLKAIKARINDEDLLSKEGYAKLQLEQTSLSKEIEILGVSMARVLGNIKWYETNAKLLNARKKQEQDFLELEEEEAKNQPIIEKLLLHEKAEPYKVLVDNFNRLEKEIKVKKHKEENLIKELEELELKIKKTHIEKEKSQQHHIVMEKEFGIWLPKLERVSNLDTDIKNVKEAKLKVNNAIETYSKTITNIGKKNLEQEEACKEKETSLNKIEAFLEKHKNVSAFEKESDTWYVDLMLRKKNREHILNGKSDLKEKEERLTKLQEAWKENKKTFDTENKKLTILNEALAKVSTSLGAKKLEASLSEKQQLENEKSNWKECLRLAEIHMESLEKKVSQEREQQTFEIERKRFEEKHLGVQSEIKKAGLALEDAEKILDLERVIADFEKERKKLIAGQPCHLCGSTNHPYVRKYETIEISKTKQKVKDRKKILEKFQEEGQSIAIGIAEIVSKIKTNTTQIKELVGQSSKVQNEYNNLNPSVKIDAIKAIKSSILKLDVTLVTLADNIAVANKLQKEKDEKDIACKTQKELINELNLKKEALVVKGTSLKDEIKKSKESLSKMVSETEILEVNLKDSLGQYGLSLPIPEGSTGFIDKMKNEINVFRIKSKEQVATQHRVLQLRKDIENDQNQLNEKLAARKEVQKEFGEIEQKLAAFLLDRKNILPLEISTDKKRKTLQLAKEEARKKLDVFIASFQELQKGKATKEKEKENIAQEKSVQEQELNEVSATLETEIAESDFNARDEIEGVYLTLGEKTKFSKIRRELADRKITLKTLRDKLQSEFEEQKRVKDFEISEEEALQKRQEIEASKNKLLKRTGEIKQKFELDNQIKKRNETVFVQIAAQEKVLKKWTDLLKILGDSKHSFNTYVQRLTLRNLIKLANFHLYKLNKRFSLKMDKTYKKGEELDFKLIDHYQTNEVRYVDTSSGGEKFLISLALALGLSDLASNNVKIDSLFIDEGFGTLDSKTLETVIATLETLQAQGKMIGIISHVENLKDRIPTQIQVLKKSNGVSEIEII